MSFECEPGIVIKTANGSRRLGAGDMDEDDRQALETVRDLISDLISRPG